MPRCVHRGSADPTRGRPPPTAGLRRSPAPRTRGVRPGWFDGLALDRPFAVSRMDGVGETVTGYMHPRYARSHQEFGSPRELPRCRGWVLERPIPGFAYTDAMGCYPLFACQDWSQLHLDVEDLRNKLVSLVLV